MLDKLSCHPPTLAEAAAYEKAHTAAESSPKPISMQTASGMTLASRGEWIPSPPPRGQLVLPPPSAFGLGASKPGFAVKSSRYSGPIVVTVAPRGESWRLRRGGQPYIACGAGGWTVSDLEAVARAGGRSFRTWQADRDASETLDRAQELDMTVSLGLALADEGSSPGFYADAHAVEEQRKRVTATVEAYRNHPALLVWGVGNELENIGPLQQVPERVWREWGELVRLVKKLDPNHPTMISVAEVSQEKIDLIKKYLPDLDILGVNAYAAAPTIGRRLKQFGWDKPYALSEFAHVGPWEAPVTSWGAPLEPTSNEKAIAYRRGFAEGVLAHPRAAVGGWAFWWPGKWEGDKDYFSLSDEHGNTVNAVDDLHELWTGQAPQNKAPQISSVEFDGREKYVSAGQLLNARLAATDPDGDPLKAHWEVRVDEWGYRKDGSNIEHEDILPSLTPHTNGAADLGFHAPDKPGPYRLYLYVTDGRGHVATASAPFFVRGAGSSTNGP